ncbi:MAG: membrane protein of unknown function [Promethearchaeota archaeon]|nr:MAG: membrane protein of unknown function [Candidatus Lokiarchaeota archaeon]
MSIIDLFAFPHFWMMIGLISSLTVALLTVAFHKPQQWFLVHRVFVGIALVFGIIGVIILFRLHLTLLHAILGLIGLILLVLSATGGFIAKKKTDPQLRSGHIWFGRVLYIYFLIVIIIGIFTFL